MGIHVRKPETLVFRQSDVGRLCGVAAFEIQLPHFVPLLISVLQLIDSY
jgi:hypothetical protein